MKKPLHVLIVEDSELDASLMSRQLKTGKYDLLTKRVETEAAYREALDSQPWDVILCDYRLSDFDGMAALHLYNERGLDIPFIMVSATMTEDLIVEAMRSGARDYVMKAHLNRLLPAIERELREAEVRRENVRTSQALRESESRYRSLFENMIEGYVYCRLIYEQNVPKDFVFIDVNARFEELTGLKNVAGKNVSDIIPGIQTTNPDLFATYGRVALTGKSEQLETYLAQLGTWYSISVYSPKQEHFVAVFENITERKNAEEMLNLLKISVDRASDAAYWLNPEGQFVYVNDSACRSLGYEKHELMKLKIYDVDVLSTPAGWDSLWKQFSENRTVQLESKHRRSDGSVFSVEIISTFVKYGEKQYICGFARDISERKKAEEALRESEGKYRLLAESSPEMIYLIGRDGRVTYVNGAAASQFRAHPRDLVGKRLSDLFPPDNASRNLETISKTIESKKPIFREVLQKFPTGEIWLDARLTPLLDDNGDVIGVLGLSSDITERKNAEKALRESEMKFRLLFDNMDEGFALNEVILDERGRAVDFRFLDVNRAYERHTGMKSGDLVGKTIREAMPLVDQSQIENYGKVALTGEPMAFEYFSKTFGRYLRVRSFSPQRGRFAAVFEDITERKQAEVALRESEQRFSKVFYASPVPASITRESDGRYVDVNESFLKRMGYDREEVIGRSALDIGFWAEPSDRNAMVAAMQERGALRNFQVRFKTKSGEIGHALLSRDIIELAGEKHYIGTTLDITERVRTEEALRESEERFRSLFENSSIGFYRTTPDGHVLLANPAFIRMLGYESFEQFSKINLEKGDYAPQYSRFEFRKRIEKDGEIKGLESTWTRKDGTRIFVRESAKVTRRADGKVLYYEGTVEDVTDRKLAEEKLRESEQKFRSVADTASTAMFIYQGERFRFVNRYGQLLTGYSQDELLQKTFWELVHPDHREMVRQRGLARQSGDPVAPRYEFKIIAKNGEVHWVDFTAGKIEFEGEPAAIGTIVDITQRKQAEEELREKENRMRIIIEGTPYLFFYTQDLEKKITYISPSVETITGHSVDDWRFQSHWFVTENRINEHAREITNAHLRGELTEGPILVEVKHADGHPILLEVYETPIVSDGHVTGLQGVAHDITERKRTEESLIRLNKAVEASGEVIFMTDPDGIFTFVNGAFARLYGYQPEEVVGTATPRILKSGRQSAEQYASFWQALKNKQIVKGEWTNRTKDGRFVTIAATANPILDANGTIIGFLAIQRNVTDQRSLEEQMRQAQKMESIGTLASGIAHDFNNILGIILGHASLIERFRNEPARLSESVATIINATKRGAAVVRQMLTFARKNEVEFKPLLINDSVNEIEKLLRETFPRTIALVCRLDQKLPLITADATQIHQVLLNLCVNARDAMGGSGTLTISTSHCSGAALQGRFVKAIHASYVVVEVRDTGSGMDEETRRRIFEPFFTTKGVGKGTGLGLSVVFGIMESHDGFVDVVSKVGHGTTFSLYFPVQSPAFGGSERDSGPDQESAGGTETVLVVEDEESLRESARLSLSLKGYTVLTAENGVNAMEIFKSRWKEIAVVVCDFGLPKHDGREVLSMMKAVNPAVRFVLASGFIDPEEKSEILKDGAKDFLQKPYVANDLLRKIREVIDF